MKVIFLIIEDSGEDQSFEEFRKTKTVETPEQFKKFSKKVFEEADDRFIDFTYHISTPDGPEATATLKQWLVDNKLDYNPLT